MLNTEQERLIEVEWSDVIAGAYNTTIKVVGNTQTEVLAIVAGAVAQLKLDIASTNGRIDNKTKQSVVDFSIRLNGKNDLDNLIKKLKQDPKIIDVYRTAN